VFRDAFSFLSLVNLSGFPESPETSVMSFHSMLALCVDLRKSQPPACFHKNHVGKEWICTTIHHELNGPFPVGASPSTAQCSMAITLFTLVVLLRFILGGLDIQCFHPSLAYPPLSGCMHPILKGTHLFLILIHLVDDTRVLGFPWYG
jgi:hypothetical protein